MTNQIVQQVRDAFAGRGWPPGEDGSSLLIKAVDEIDRLLALMKRWALDGWTALTPAERDAILSAVRAAPDEPESLHPATNICQGCGHAMAECSCERTLSLSRSP